jgi:hypothetical protein
MIYEEYKKIKAVFKSPPAKFSVHEIKARKT